MVKCRQYCTMLLINHFQGNALHVITSPSFFKLRLVTAHYQSHRCFLTNSCTARSYTSTNYFIKMTPLSTITRVGVLCLKYLRNTRTLATVATPVEEVSVAVLEDNCHGIAVIRLNRPERKNALGQNLTSQLLDILDCMKYDTNVRVVILRSLVKNIFCAGADLKERATFTNTQVHAFVNKLRHLTNTIENLPVPVIAALDGVAVGGGLEIALACDLRVAATNAKMGLVETSLAIIPGAGGTQRLPRVIGVPKAKELIYTARVIDGQSAYNMGLVNNVVKQNSQGDAAYEDALKLAKEILPNGPVGIQMAKKAINKGSEVDIGSGCFIEEACYSKVIVSKDRLEGLQAFKEKRKPNYTGE